MELLVMKEKIEKLCDLIKDLLKRNDREYVVAITPEETYSYPDFTFPEYLKNVIDNSEYAFNELLFDDSIGVDLEDFVLDNVDDDDEYGNPQFTQFLLIAIRAESDELLFSVERIFGADGEPAVCENVEEVSISSLVCDYGDKTVVHVLEAYLRILSDGGCPWKEIPTPEQVLEYRAKYDGSETESMEIQKWCQAFEDKYDLMTKVYEENGKFGVKDATGQVMVPAIYDSIEYTHDDMCRSFPVPASLNGKMALVASDGKGTPCTDFEFDSISCQYGYYFLEKDGKYGFADLDGYIYLHAIADDVDPPVPYCDIVNYEVAGKTGFIALGVRVDSGALYEEYELDEDEYVVVYKDGVKGYLDIKGHFTQDESQKYFCEEEIDGWDS